MTGIEIIPEIRSYKEVPIYASVVAEIARSLVDAPDCLAVETVGGDGGMTVVLTVGSTDLGKLIGKQGRTAKSLRLILSAMSRKAGRRLALEIRSREGDGPAVARD